MRRAIELLNMIWKDKHVRVEDKSGVLGQGIFEHIDWYIQPDYYSKQNNIPMLKCFLIPFSNKDKETYKDKLEDGKIKLIGDTPSLHIYELNDNGEIIINERLKNSII